ncbi:DUF4870 domain-containing protein [Marisediminicola antarctica]|uniref:DUF4870 domain-containing protein n=1 Tax=Marisediminicola antarctica TaxID=674079 RepID=A0A7L5AKC3_9MICO|nr:DUF4870 domain-containing protein [Marisediminicola antarctica]QHO69814.1 hypothetical protein BHD05_09325 [Marisediminicola antarctica]
MTNPSQSAPPPRAPLTPSDDLQWGSFAHLGGVLGILPSLIIWLVYKDRGSFTNAEGKEALNFQITAAIAELVGYILMPVLIGFVIVPAVYAARIVFSILAYLKTKGRIGYRYPFSLRLIK